MQPVFPGRHAREGPGAAGVPEYDNFPCRRGPGRASPDALHRGESAGAQGGVEHRLHAPVNGDPHDFAQCGAFFLRGPAARWIAPSTPPPPSRLEFAALTMTSTASVVTSRRQTRMLVSRLILSSSPPGFAAHCS